jgi:hypothetical protein
VKLLADDQDFHVELTDTILHMAEMPARSIDLAVTSPPFPTLYAYSSDDADIGNSEDLDGDARLHLSWFYRQFARILKPGRAAVIHVMQIPRMKRAGGQGLFDFRGLNIRLAERAGLIFEYDWAVWVNPQAQAITTKSRELQFAGLESDRARSRGAFPDYLLKFTAPGDNKVKVDSEGDVSRNDWIDWAEALWRPEKYPISVDGRKKAFTLNTEEAKGPEDTRHICPMKLSICDRLVRLFSNPGETVFDPFTGVGSTGFTAVRRGRRFYGTEMKPEYQQAAIANLARAVKMRNESNRTLFDGLDDAVCDETVEVT